MGNQNPNYQHESQSAASQNPTLNELREVYQMALRTRQKNIPRLQISFDDFKEQLKAHACIIIAERGDNHTFEYDKPTHEVCWLLWCYTIGSAEFKGNLSKGIALVGDYGCGKTLIMEAYGRLINYHIRKNEWRIVQYDFHTSRQLFNRVLEKGVEFYQRHPLIIDEIGRETRVAKTWGTESMPLIDLLFERHRLGSLTHITANFTLQDLSGDDMYGGMLGDRFKEMFNFIEMKGGSRRK